MLMFFTAASKARRSRDYRRLEGIVPSCLGIWTKIHSFDKVRSLFCCCYIFFFISTVSQFTCSCLISMNVFLSLLVFFVFFAVFTINANVLI